MEDRTSTEPGEIDNSDVSSILCCCCCVCVNVVTGGDEGDEDVEVFEGGVMMAKHFYLNDYAR
eukprot:CAMPEP_0178965908 /NCGR_PEP_ID=MMETSP0789-20121207/16604_1 /TAXON_ID=3005 /ORGANISM="Rhizosolenia setigera, Strain CCMP 1694" /LENGTH=62 /DNA_ID=CAMNT_0020651067 /DNA_START=102 /DNA_END=290 /DNA_ORIENTATION=+